MGVNNEIVACGGGGSITAEGGIRQPDAQWGKNAPAAEFNPSMILETGFTQSLGALQTCARYWVENFESVKVVVVLKAHPDTTRINLQIWNAVGADQRAFKAQEETLTYNEATGVVMGAGNGIRLSFFDIVGRQPIQARGEGDITLTAADLRRIATTQWAFQSLI